MMRKKILWMIAAVCLYSCDGEITYQRPKDSTPPGPVTEIGVENINGGAILRFTAPDDDDLLGIKAQYQFRPDGEIRETWASAHTDSIIVQGFPDTKARVVNLIAIDESGNESKVVDVNIEPLTPPVELALKTIELNETFGGISVHINNPTNSNLAVHIYVDDEDMKDPYNVYYSDLTDIRYSSRGLSNELKNFRITIRDHYDNWSQVHSENMTPVFEEFIEPADDLGYAIFERWGYDEGYCKYRGDAPDNYPKSSRDFSALWNGTTPTRQSNYWHTGEPGNPLRFFIDLDKDHPKYDKQMYPIYFTIDLGRKVFLSRMKHWMRSRDVTEAIGSSGHRYWQMGAMKTFNIYATNNPKAISDVGDGSISDNQKYWTSWSEVDGTDEWKNDWVLIGTGSTYVPSGADPSNPLHSDFEFADLGYDVEFPEEVNITAYKYLRFEVIDTWGMDGSLHIARMDFFGAEDN